METNETEAEANRYVLSCFLKYEWLSKTKPRRMFRMYSGLNWKWPKIHSKFWTVYYYGTIKNSRRLSVINGFNDDFDYIWPCSHLTLIFIIFIGKRNIMAFPSSRLEWISSFNLFSYFSTTDHKMTLQVVCVICLSPTKSRDSKQPDVSLAARQAAYQDVEKACS